MQLLDTSPERERAHEIQRLQMEVERRAAYATAHDMKVEPQQPPIITVREARNGA